MAIRLKQIESSTGIKRIFISLITIIQLSLRLPINDKLPNKYSDFSRYKRIMDAFTPVFQILHNKSGDLFIRIKKETIFLDEVELIGVIDSDTLKVKQKQTTFNIRLEGIDAPEKDEIGYEESIKLTNLLLQGVKRIYIEKDSKQNRDQYNRMITAVYYATIIKSNRNLLQFGKKKELIRIVSLGCTQLLLGICELYRDESEVKKYSGPLLDYYRLCSKYAKTHKVGILNYTNGKIEKLERNLTKSDILSKYFTK